MKSTEFITETTIEKIIKKTDNYMIRKVQRLRPDDSTETKFEILDKNGVTKKIFDTYDAAKSWIVSNWSLVD